MRFALHLTLPVLGTQKQLLQIPVYINTFENTPCLALIDSGAELNIISEKAVKSLKLQTQKLPTPQQVELGDGTCNYITHYIPGLPIRLRNGRDASKTYESTMTFYVHQLPRDIDIVLGHEFITEKCQFVNYNRYKVHLKNGVVVHSPDHLLSRQSPNL